MSQDRFDLIVIGTGPAGSNAATSAAENGARVAMVERDKIGGTCLNYGCDPTKTLLHSAHVLYNARHAERYGLHIPAADVDWPTLLAHIDRTIRTIRGGDEAQAREDLGRKGITTLKGTAAFVSAHTIQIGQHTLRAEQIIIAVGSQPVIPQIAGLRDAGFITNQQAVALPQLPRRLAIIGGGPIGIEFGQLFARFGVEVTILEQSPMLLSKDDRELADQLCALLSKQGLRTETKVAVQQVRRDESGKHLTIRCADRAAEELHVDEILVASGFQPALEQLNLAAAGVETADDQIKVDATLRTNVPHIWAAGDAASVYQFTHVAAEQGRLAARNAFAKQPQPFDDRAIPWVTYTDPELAHVGKTEEQLREDGVEYRIGRKLMDSLERAIATAQTAGQVKLLIGQDGAILGGHILASGAGELIAPIVLAMRAELPVEALATIILPYPTMTEAVRAAARSGLDRA